MSVEQNSTTQTVGEGDVTLACARRNRRAMDNLKALSRTDFRSAVRDGRNYFGPWGELRRTAAIAFGREHGNSSRDCSTPRSADARYSA